MRARLKIRRASEPRARSRARTRVFFPLGSVACPGSKAFLTPRVDVRLLQKRCAKNQEVREFAAKGEGTEETLGRVGCVVKSQA